MTRLLLRFYARNCHILLAAIAVSLASAPFYLRAAESSPILVGTSEIYGSLTKQGSSSGIYDRFLKHFDSIVLVFAPNARLEILFDDKKVDCLFPASTTTMPNGDDMLTSTSIKETPAYFFTKSPYTSHEELVGKRIAIRRGLTIGGVRDQIDATYIELESDRAMIKFLEYERVDAFVSYLSDVKPVYSSLKEPLDFYNASIPVYTANEAFVCHNTPRNLAFIEEANTITREFLDSTEPGKK